MAIFIIPKNQLNTKNHNKNAIISNFLNEIRYMIKIYPAQIIGSNTIDITFINVMKPCEPSIGLFCKIGTTLRL